MRFSIGVVLLGLLVFVIGCSSKPKITGKVTFDDGTPLTTGEVRFESPGFTASGKIQSDGTYTMGSIADKDGVPKGSYKVSVYALNYSGITPGMDPAKAPPAKPLVAKEFLSGDTSGLVCEVKGKTTFDIKVQPPK